MENDQFLNLEEFCDAMNTQKDLVIQMIEYQLIIPKGDNPEHWLFDLDTLKRGKIAASFYHDLEINMPGVALALDLLDQIKRLEVELELHTHHF